MQFKELGIIDPILKALVDAGYQRPSPIQEQAIPPVLAGRDLVGCAQTGTGKTAAFAIPIIQHFYEGADNRRRGKAIRALVLTPTRELAIQIGDCLKEYGRYAKLRYTVIYGGVGQNPQVESLRRGVEALVATPGRLLDLMGQGFVDLSGLEVFVLDEADRMLDMGFIHDVKKVIAALPAKRQTLLFSATMPEEIARLADTILNNPVKVAVTPVASTVDAIDQQIYFVDKVNKTRLLADLLDGRSVQSALVFTRTKHGADKVVRELKRRSIHAMAIHGNKSQSARQDALAQLKRGELRVLVATDIAARGIDIAELSHVINYNLPNEPETYVHRIGRTGRAGLSGIALSFCDIDEKPYLTDIEKLIGKKVAVISDHPYPMENLTPQNPKAAPKASSSPRGRRPAPHQRPQTLNQRTQIPNQRAQAPMSEGQPRNQAASPEKPVREAARPQPARPARCTAEGYQRPAGQSASGTGGSPSSSRGGGRGRHGQTRRGGNGKKPTLRQLTE